MLTALRKSDGVTVHAYDERKVNGPFACLDCGEEMILKAGRRSTFFAHANPLARHNAVAETEEHRACKLEIYQALRHHPHVRNVSLEHRLNGARPDIFAEINGTPVAIEVQMSSLSLETITARTIRYHQLGIYVLWLLQWTPKLDLARYSPKVWEKWIHAAYFGRVFYWVEDLSIASYCFEPVLKSVPKTSWFDRKGHRQQGGGYTRRSIRYREPVRHGILHLVNDFAPRERLWWEGGGLKVPDAKLFTARSFNFGFDQSRAE